MNFKKIKLILLRFKTSYFYKSAHNSELRPQIFLLLLHQIKPLALKILICKFQLNHDHTTSYIEYCLYFLWKCYANAFVLADAQTAEEWSQTVSYLKDLCYPKLCSKKQNNQKPKANIIGARRSIILSRMQGGITISSVYGTEPLPGFRITCSFFEAK